MKKVAPSSKTFRALIRAISQSDEAKALRLIRENPGLALETEKIGATRTGPGGFFLKKITHYLYAGDTALHIAAAAYLTPVVKALVKSGADPRAKNRRGAEPLHYAVDGGPAAPHWDESEQKKTIALLIRSGADANATDKGGTAPLHRAVRNRCLSAVKVLNAQGANAHLKNGGGSTPLQLAEWTTGRGGSGTPEAKRLQMKIIRLLDPSRS